MCGTHPEPPGIQVRARFLYAPPTMSSAPFSDAKDRTSERTKTLKNLILYMAQWNWTREKNRIW